MVLELVAASNALAVNITINSSSVTASSTDGAGIGGGLYGASSVSDIIINNSSVTARSTNGAGIGGGDYGNVCVSRYYH